MGLFVRLKSLVSGFFGVWTGKLEMQNPELLIEDARSRIDKSRKEAEKQLVEIQTWSEMLRLDMKAAEKELALVKDKIILATEHQDRDLLIELIMQEEEYTTRLQERKVVFDSAVTEALKIRDQYKLFESEMNARLRELQSMKSQVRIASMKEKISTIGEKYGFEGKSKSEINDGMDRLRTVINTKTARSIAIENLRLESTESRIVQLSRSVEWDKASKRADSLLASKRNGLVEVNENT